MVRRPLFHFCLDLVLVVLFVAIGRSSHTESLAGTLATALPFVLAACLAWLLPAVRRSSAKIYPAGLLVWLSTLVLGQLLRVAFGGTTALAFIIVTAVATAVFLLGWRLIYKILVKG